MRGEMTMPSTTAPAAARPPTTVRTMSNRVYRARSTARTASVARTIAAQAIARTSKRRKTMVIASALDGQGVTEKTTGAATAPSATNPPSQTAAARRATLLVARSTAGFISVDPEADERLAEETGVDRPFQILERLTRFAHACATRSDDRGLTGFAPPRCKVGEYLGSRPLMTHPGERRARMPC